MTSIELHLANKRLKKQIAERDAAIADRDAMIDKLSRDVALLKDAVQQLLAQRRGGHRIPEGQGLLFPEAQRDIEAATDAASDDDEDNDEDDDDDRPRRKSSGKRTPRKLDLTGLPVEDRLHEVPEEQRVDPVTGQPLVQIGEDVFEELDYILDRAKALDPPRPG